jgi:ribosomal protein S18 acetylase RimI-like enzyme
MKTRAAVAADTGFLVGLFLSSMRPYITSARGSWDQVKEDRQFRGQLQLGSARIILDGGSSVGFFMTRDQGQDVELHTLCILPEYQRHSLGTAAIRQILAGLGGVSVALCFQSSR